MNKKEMFNCLRNPFRYDETIIRIARIQAADELERLYEMESKIESCLKRLIEKKKSFGA